MKGKTLYDYPTVKDWVINEWLLQALTIGIEEDRFWGLTPKTIEVYFKAYQKRREVAIQDIWLQGYYFMSAIGTCFDSKNKYPEMPFKEKVEEDLAQDEEWLKRERQRAWNSFATFLFRNKKN